jgi:hypothetical protein
MPDASERRQEPALERRVQVRLRGVGEEVCVRVEEGVARLARCHFELELLFGSAIGDVNRDAICVPVPEQRHGDAVVVALVELAWGAPKTNDAGLLDGSLSLDAVVAANGTEPRERVRDRPAT